MKTNKNIVLIYYKAENLTPVNGPGAVVYQLKQKWLEAGISFDDRGVYSSDYFSILKLFIMIFFSKNKVINVHQSGNKIPFIILLISKINKRNNYYFTTHGCTYLQDKYNGVRSKFLNRIIEKVLIEYFDNVICVSKMHLDDLVSNFNIKGKIQYVNNGYIPYDECIESKTQENNNLLSFLFTGGIKKNKGIFESLELIKQLREYYTEKNVKLYVIGDKIDSDYVEYTNYIMKHKLEQNVKYEGLILDKSKVYSFYKSVDFVLGLSHYDTFNVSIVEALSVGTPVIISKKTGAKEFVKDNLNGIVVDLNETYYSKIIKYIDSKFNNPYFCKNSRNLCIDSVKTYTWNHTANSYIKVLK